MMIFIYSAWADSPLNSLRLLPLLLIIFVFAPIVVAFGTGIVFASVVYLILEVYRECGT